MSHSKIKTTVHHMQINDTDCTPAPRPSSYANTKHFTLIEEKANKLINWIYFVKHC